MSERSGIEIDYCPKCRGVWLDRGELDKIIERSADQAGASPPPLPMNESRAAPAPAQYAPPYPPQPYPHQHQGKPDDSHYGYPSPYGKRKKSWLSEIFD
jgi:hypothetical protein